jgi:alpha-1,2-mannosyltransferase
MVTTEWLERRLAWAVAALTASAVFMAWWLHWFDLVDLEVYRSGATAFLHGRDIYSAHPRVIPLPFTYPPFAAIVFVPLGVLPDVAARVAMSFLSGAALVFAALAALRLGAPGWPARSRWTVALGIAAATPLIEPIRDTFRLGQVNLVLMALVLADLTAIVASDRSGGRRVPRGVLLGLATAVKLTPGIFILYLLAIRRTREALTAMASAAAATVVAALLMPSESAHFWRHLVFDDRRIGSAGSVWNQSLRGAVARLSGSPDQAHLLWLGLALVVVVAGLALAARLSGPGPRAASASASASGSGSGAGRPLLGLGVAALTGLLVSPISWNHHWVWFLPLAIALAVRAVETGRRFDRLIAGAWVATFCLASISWWPFAGQDDYRLGPLNTVAADCYVLAALFVAGLIAWAELGLMNFRCVHTGNSSGQSITRSPPGLP